MNNMNTIAGTWTCTTLKRKLSNSFARRFTGRTLVSDRTLAQVRLVRGIPSMYASDRVLRSLSSSPHAELCSLGRGKVLIPALPDGCSHADFLGRIPLSDCPLLDRRHSSTDETPFHTWHAHSCSRSEEDLPPRIGLHQRTADTDVG